MAVYEVQNTSIRRAKVFLRLGQFLCIGTWSIELGIGL
jgi:hypothetical protein